MENDNINIREQTIEELEQGQEVENLKKIEASLFISAKWMTVQELVAITDINPILLKELLAKLQEKYEKTETALELLAKENIWKMDVKPDYSNIVTKLATGKSEFTKAEQETLAVIAYKQPIKQSVIIKIRGNKAYEHIKRFISLGLLKTKKAGHTLEISLSEEFHDYFHVSNSEEAVEKVEEKQGEVEKVEEEQENVEKNSDESPDTETKTI